MKHEKTANVIYNNREKTSSTENFTKTANVILNTKTLKTKVCKSRGDLQSGLRQGLLAETSSPEVKGLVEQGHQESEKSANVIYNNRGKTPPIHYMSASIKKNAKPTTTTKTVNVDFRLEGSASTNFNKIVFSLTDRRREFLNNVPQSWWMDMEYNDAQLQYDEVLQHYPSDVKWIGKGRHRPRYNKGKFVNTEIKQGLTAVLLYDFPNNCYNLWVWIDGHRYELRLTPTDNDMYPYRTDTVLTEKITYKPRGGWL